MLTISQLIDKYPVAADQVRLPGCVNEAITGKIPMDFFLMNEHQIRAIRKSLPYKTRLYWRGKRTGGDLNTAREDATSVVIYTAKV